MKAEPLLNKRYGRLVVVGASPRGNRFCACRCDCGTRITTSRYRLLNETTKSCGCLRSELLQKRIFRHGHNTKTARSRTYRAWESMKARCHLKTHSNYYKYGARGITVCERWRSSFENFLADMGECPDGKTIDREDNDGNYEPGNCAWASAAKQARNRSSVLLNMELAQQIRRTDKSVTTAALSRAMQLPYSVVWYARRGRTWT